MKESTSRAGLFAGAMLIVLGLVFLIQNLTGFSLDNWWGIFLLVPAGYMLFRTYQEYQEHKAFTMAGRNNLMAFITIALIAVITLFNLNWGTMWPLFLIIGGVGLLLRMYVR